MSPVACWRKIPYEIALCIFQYVVEDLDYPQRKCNLANFQRVCKSWSKAAQKLLYSEIILDELKDGLFLNTIDQISPSLGVLVKKVKITDEFGQTNHMEDVFPPFDKHCPNLEEIFAEADSDKAELYSFLLLSARINSLKRIDERLEMKKALLTYPFVAFKYRNTLMELYVDFDYHIGDYDSKKTLIDQLQHFRSLKHVIITLFHRAHTIEKTLDNCPKTVDTLTFQHTQEDGSWIEPDYNKVIPISNIKKLIISHSARFGPSHLKYIKSKLNALESFEVAPTALAQDLDVQFLDLCASIESYDVCIAIEDALGNNDGLRNRVESLIKRSKKDEEFCTEKKFEVDLDYLPPDDIVERNQYYALPNWNLNLIRKKRSKIIMLRYIKEGKEDPLDDLLHPNNIVNYLQLYSPNVITIYNIEPIDVRREFIVEQQFQQDFETLASVRRYFAWLCKDRSWQILDGAISTLCNQKNKNSRLIIGNMIICDESSSLLQSKIDHKNYISELEISHSIIYYKVLPMLSRKLSIVQTLVFFSSWILMDDDKYSLKIFLPSTYLQKLGIIISPFLPTDNEENQPRRSILDNDILLQATSNVGKYILKIETPKETFTSYRQGHKNIRNVGEKEALDIQEGTKDNFLIWIKCKHVSEFAIVGLEEDCSWTQKFEQVSTMRVAADNSK